MQASGVSHVFRSRQRLHTPSHLPVVEQNIRSPDQIVREADVSDPWIIRHVPLQVEIRPILKQIQTQRHSNINVDLHVVRVVLITSLDTLSRFMLDQI